MVRNGNHASRKRRPDVTGFRCWKSSITKSYNVKRVTKRLWHLKDNMRSCRKTVIWRRAVFCRGGIINQRHVSSVLPEPTCPVPDLSTHTTFTSSQTYNITWPRFQGNLTREHFSNTSYRPLIFSGWYLNLRNAQKETCRNFYFQFIIGGTSTLLVGRGPI